MSRLAELISELCPKGVPYLALNQVAEYSKNRIEASEIDSTTYVGVDNLLPNKQGKIESSYVPREGRLIRYIEGDILIGNIRPYLKKIWLADQAGGTNGDVLVIHINNNDMYDKFLYYCLSSDQFFLYDMQHAKGAKMPRGDKQAVMAYKIPVPPLEVQREIVRVLDHFTLLSAELSAELKERKQQYSYYLNKMLSFGDETNRIRLGELFDFRNGLSKGKDAFGKGSHFIRYTDVYNHRALHRDDITALVECSSSEIEKLKVSRGDVLFTRTSETAEDVGWASVMLDNIEDCVFNGFTIKAKPKTNLLVPEYCAYCFSTDEFRKYVTTHCSFTTRASLTGSTIAEYELPVPPLNQQRIIADALSRFETICNDLEKGLPAEIEARKQQYEYYRDKLLTFKAKEN